MYAEYPSTTPPNRRQTGPLFGEMTFFFFLDREVKGHKGLT